MFEVVRDIAGDLVEEVNVSFVEICAIMRWTRRPPVVELYPTSRRATNSVSILFLRQSGNDAMPLFGVPRTLELFSSGTCSGFRC